MQRKIFRFQIDDLTTFSFFFFEKFSTRFNSIEKIKRFRMGLIISFEFSMNLSFFIFVFFLFDEDEATEEKKTTN